MSLLAANLPLADLAPVHSIHREQHFRIVRRILVTSALPYANGPIHIGHLVEYIQTDIWVRFQKLVGNRCVYFCADDTHGTAIMIRARQEGVSEEAVDRRDAAGPRSATSPALTSSSTTTAARTARRTAQLCEEIWAVDPQGGAGQARRTSSSSTIRRPARFWPIGSSRAPARSASRPTSTATTASKCGHHYSPTELIDPVSTLSRREAGDPQPNRTCSSSSNSCTAFSTSGRNRGDHLQPEIANYLKGHFLGEPLRDWDISRPAPYFGFEIPDSPGNYWYVWFDAPIGYMASTQQWCDRARREVRRLVAQRRRREIHHFIGKDITYFHTLFWPGDAQDGRLQPARRRSTSTAS